MNSKLLSDMHQHMDVHLYLYCLIFFCRKFHYCLSMARASLVKVNIANCTLLYVIHMWRQNAQCMTIPCSCNLIVIPLTVLSTWLSKVILITTSHYAVVLSLLTSVAVDVISLDLVWCALIRQVVHLPVIVLILSLIIKTDNKFSVFSC